ncbi:MAG TPA: geopeptide radical SAM maturase, partial [Geobacteraceae bacterium]
VPRLTEIAHSLGEAARSRGTGFCFSLTTNATLLTRTVAEALLPHGLVRANLTIDGPREVHDRQRPFVSGKGSFDLIVSNIKRVWDLIDIQLGGNFSKDNWHEFPRLLDHLVAEGVTPEMIGNVQFAPIAPKSGKSAGAETSVCCSSAEPWLMEAGPILREEVLRRGFTADKPTMAACMIEFEHDLVVNWDGTLYKCPVFMGWPELSVGTLAEGVKDYSATHNLTVWQNDECLACAYLPLCFGGCRFLTLQATGTIDGVDCRRPFLDATLEAMIRQDLRYRPTTG